MLNPHTGVVISVLVSKRERDRKTYGKVEAVGGGGGGKSSTKKKRTSSILDSVELPCTCAAFRPHNKVSSLRAGNSVQMRLAQPFSTSEIQIRLEELRSLSPVGNAKSNLTTSLVGGREERNT